VKFERLPDCAVLEIQDFGRGLPQSVMDRFQRTGTGSGVGLAGIRERIKELGGDFTICSSSGGTTLRSTVPLTVDASNAHTETVAKRDITTSKAPSNNIVSNFDRAS
jgi:signal transduction histidine kinase